MAEKNAAEGAGLPARRGPSRRARLVIFIVVVVLVLAGGAWWYSGLGYESTDDAFVEGLTVRISPRISGIVTRVAVDDNQHVKAGDLLFELDPRDYQAAASKARAAVAAAGSRAATAKANLALVKASTEATLRQAESKVAVAQATLKRRHAELAAAKVEAARALRDAERYRKLSTNDFASRQRLDQANAQAESAAAQVRAAEGAAAEAKADVARAQAELASAQTAPQQIAVREAELTTAQAELESAQAALERAELDLSYTEITAPHDGVITRKTASEGDFVSPGEALSSLVYGRPWVVANFKETQLTTMQPGQPVKVDIDAYPGMALRGHVDSIQRGTGSYFSLLPPENATGNFVKVVQRVPVKIVLDGELDPARPLSLGMSVVPTVNVDAAPAKSAE